MTIADFDALQYAIDNSADGYVALDADISWEGTALVVGEGRTVTLDFNGHMHTWTDDADWSGDDPSGWSAVVVYGSLAVVGEGTVSAGGEDAVVIHCAEGATLDLLGGTYLAGDGGGIEVYGSAHVADGVSVAARGFALAVGLGEDSSEGPSTLVVDGGDFSSEADDALIAIGGGTATVNGDAFSGPNAIRVVDDASVTVNGGEFTSVPREEVPYYEQGTAWCAYGGALTVTGGTFRSGGGCVFRTFRLTGDPYDNPQDALWGTVTVAPASYGAVTLDAADGVVLAAATENWYAEVKTDVDVPEGALMLGAGTYLATDELAAQAWDYMAESLTIDESNVIWYASEVGADETDSPIESEGVAFASESAVAVPRRAAVSRTREVGDVAGSRAQTSDSALPQAGDAVSAAAFAALIGAAAVTLATSRLLRRRS